MAKEKPPLCARTWQDLRQFGIVPLTGEACNMGKRLLCDVTEQGRLALCEIFGLPRNTRFQESWNSGDAADPHVGSIFLAYGMLEPIAAICLLRAGYRFAVCTDRDGVYGVSSHEEVEGLRRGGFHDTYCRVDGQPHEGLSNTHAFSGRAQ